MSLKVFNTLTKHKDDFTPLEPGKVKMYVCGVTPYNHPHIGNARPFVTWDVIRRYMEYSGYQVMHIQNFTDVDDKIIHAANTERVSWDTIANRYIASYFEVMDRLNIRRANLYPRVSEHMRQIIEMVSKLINDGFAYEVNGDVYFSVEKFSGYGKLSGRSLDDMQAGARVEVDERKDHPMDFALWKSAKPGEPAWDSPWGKGRPGWHIECSAMSFHYLGESFDFHGGGSDLVFPHHENEIAQSEAFTGHEPFVHYWLHNGFITVNEEKMSKSLGNFFLVKDILEHFAPDVLRFFILATHYRSPLDFSDERLSEAARSLERLKTVIDTLGHLADTTPGEPSEESSMLIQAASKAQEDFKAAMDDDFNTALAISVMFGLAKEINIYHNAVVSGKCNNDLKAVSSAREAYMLMGDLLGIFFGEETTDSNDGDTQLIAQLVELVIELRQQARQKKDWGTADQLRDRLGEIGIVLEDTPQGVRWKRR